MKRLWTLWEIMNTLQIHRLAAVVGMMQNVESGLDVQHAFAPTLDAAQLQESFETDFARARETLAQARDILGCMGKEMEGCIVQIDLASGNMRPDCGLSAEGLSAQVNRVRETLIVDLKKVACLWVAKDRADFLDNEHLFGEAVSKAFPSAQKDITEAGNCLAAECTTAAVWHLMRAAEVALRVLVTDRKIPLTGKPVEHREWGDLIGLLDNYVRNLRLTDKAKWQNPFLKEDQARFYNEVTGEFRGFNEAWRRHLSHAQADAFVDRDYAASVFRHVKTLMQKLTEKGITEFASRPDYWDKP